MTGSKHKLPMGQDTIGLTQPVAGAAQPPPLSGDIV